MVIYTELLNKLLNSKICLRRQNDMRLIFATEYPVGALPGEAMAAFTTLAQDALGAELEIDSLFETEQISLGERAASTIVLDGGVVFGAALSGYSKEFELAAIPRGIGSCDAEKDARQFRDIFAKCLYREGFRLIASVPMPPTGLWSSHVIDSEADLTSLRIRTYDSLSAEVFSSLGCAAMKMSFAQLLPALDKGEINAVLSSGDGAAGASLSRYFRYYSPLAYSTPLCFLIVRESSFVAMPGRWQRALR